MGSSSTQAIGAGGVGTKNHCMHGKDAIIEELLDWRPFDYFTVSTLLPMPGAPKVVMTRAVQERPNGTTHLEMRIAKPRSLHPAVSAFPDMAVRSACALSFSRFARRSLALRPTHSRCHRIS
jgi:hypothetical protein